VVAPATDDEKAYALSYVGIFTGRQIARKVGRSQEAVNRWIKEMQQEGSKTSQMQAADIRKLAIEMTAWWADRYSEYDPVPIRKALEAIDQPDRWWRQRREWSIGTWAEYALRHSV